ncbi:MAG TPA: alpha/beta hydrolase [Myxococcales bacterium]|jgi:pimeloyl-ACP methyl ester carboxylesterase|nr:alpha/beta hydrolase [Myxococcales bacterium]
MKAVICGVALLAALPVHAQGAKIVKTDSHIDALDPGIKLFVREKKAEGARATDENTVLFVHGATFPSTPDFDLQFKDYSWADRLASQGYVVYMFDKRNYGFSTREKAMDEPPAANKPLSRSYLVIRDIAAVVDHIRAKNKIARVTLIGWSWGAMTAGYYSSLYPEKVQKLVLYAPLYENTLHTNLGAGSGLQDKRHPSQFNPAMGAYRLGTGDANNKRWDGEIPVPNKDEYRDPAVQEAFNQAALATDPTSNTRTPPALRAPNGVLEDSFYQATGRRIWNAASITAPTLVIAGEDDTWSFVHDREGLMRDLSNAASKKLVLIPHATHFVLFEKQRGKFFEEIEAFLKSPAHASK